MAPPNAAPASFLWHDYETFGADPRRDRPAQFAALRTDADLKPGNEMKGKSRFKKARISKIKRGEINSIKVDNKIE